MEIENITSEKDIDGSVLFYGHMSMLELEQEYILQDEQELNFDK